MCNVNLRTYLYLGIAYFWIRKLTRETDFLGKLKPIGLALTFLLVLRMIDFSNLDYSSSASTISSSITAPHQFCQKLLHYSQDHPHAVNETALLQETCDQHQHFSIDLFALELLKEVRSHPQVYKSKGILDYNPSSLPFSIFLAKAITFADCGLETATQNYPVLQTISLLSPVFFNSKWRATLIPDVSRRYPLILLDIDSVGQLVDSFKTAERFGTADSRFYIRVRSAFDESAIPHLDGYAIEPIETAGLVITEKKTRRSNDKQH